MRQDLEILHLKLERNALLISPCSRTVKALEWLNGSYNGDLLNVFTYIDTCIMTFCGFSFSLLAENLAGSIEAELGLRILKTDVGIRANVSDTLIVFFFFLFSCCGIIIAFHGASYHSYTPKSTPTIRSLLHLYIHTFAVRGHSIKYNQHKNQSSQSLHLYNYNLHSWYISKMIIQQLIKGRKKQQKLLPIY